jgi:hypothetical protein
MRYRTAALLSAKFNAIFGRDIVKHISTFLYYTV